MPTDPRPDSAPEKWSRLLSVRPHPRSLPGEVDRVSMPLDQHYELVGEIDRLRDLHSAAVERAEMAERIRAVYAVAADSNRADSAAGKDEAASAGRIAELERNLAETSERAERAERLCAMQDERLATDQMLDHIVSQRQRIAELERELAEAREDSKRLDGIDEGAVKSLFLFGVDDMEAWRYEPRSLSSLREDDGKHGPSIREAIDAALRGDGEDEG